MRLARVPVALAALACAAAAWLPAPEQAPELRLESARGAVSIASSRNGVAMLKARDMHPGQTVTGSVAIRNTGRRAVRLTLRGSRPRGTPGRGGGSLADVLQLTVAGPRGAVAHGTAATLRGCRDLGLLRPRATRTYRVAAVFPDGGPADNDYAGSAMSVDERWVADPAGCGRRLRAPHPARARVRDAQRRGRTR
jgi:hypothetical protein